MITALIRKAIGWTPPPHHTFLDTPDTPDKLNRRDAYEVRHKLLDEEVGRYDRRIARSRATHGQTGRLLKAKSKRIHSLMRRTLKSNTGDNT